MGYAQYRSESASELNVVASPLESRAAGLHIGRMSCWPPRALSPQAIVSMIKDADMDVVVLRYAAQDIALAAGIQDPELVSFQADTLLYFERETEELPHSDDLHLLPFDADDEIPAAQLIGSVFCDYNNHYSANPLLSRIDVVKAYSDWFRQASSTGSALSMRANSTGLGDFGVCLVDHTNSEFDEILLAGIVTDARRRGYYRRMLTEIVRRTHNAGKSFVAISTQASNIGAMRAWVGLGFRPTLALNTVHVVKAESFYREHRR